MRWSAIDMWVMGYALFASGVAFLFGDSSDVFIRSHMLHGACILAALLIARYVPEHGRWWPFLRHGYPLLLFGFLYADTAAYIHLIFSGWNDPALIRFEESILGFNLIEVLSKLDATWLLEIWMAGYAFYYVLPPFVVIVLIVSNRPEIFRRMSVASCAAFFVSYAMFYLFPLEGPRYAMQSVLPPLSGWFFYPLVMKIQNAGAIHGGCMPSSHTAVAWVATYYIFKANRRIGVALVAISTLLTVGCVWGRFHYLSDVVVGLTIFLLAIWLTEWYNRSGNIDMPHDVAPSLLHTGGSSCIQ